MKLEEAIRHCEEVAGKQKKLAEKWEAEGGGEYGKTMACKRCAKEHYQLADWLRLLQRILASGDCNNCVMKKKHCWYAPRLGEQVRYNCPFYVKESEESECTMTKSKD